MWGCPSTQPLVPRTIDDRYEVCENPTAVAAWGRAQELLRGGQQAQAIELLRQCVDLCAGNVWYHIAYQDTAFALPRVEVGGEFVEVPATVAMRRLYAELEDDGESPLPPYLRARLERMDQREATCEQLLEEALRRAPAFYFAMYESGLKWRGVDRPGLAAAELERAVRSRPQFLEARRALAEVYVELGEWPGAIRHYELYLAERPDDYPVLREYLALIVYQVDGREEEAGELVDKLIARHPQDLTLQMDRAAISWQLGDLGTAAQTYKSVVQQDHEDARAVLNLGNLYYEMGMQATDQERRERWEKARTAYRYFLSLGESADFHDLFDLHFNVPYRLSELQREVGPGKPGPVTWQDIK